MSYSAGTSLPATFAPTIGLRAASPNRHVQTLGRPGRSISPARRSLHPVHARPPASPVPQRRHYASSQGCQGFGLQGVHGTVGAAPAYFQVCTPAKGVRKSFQRQHRRVRCTLAQHQVPNTPDRSPGTAHVAKPVFQFFKTIAAVLAKAIQNHPLSAQMLCRAQDLLQSPERGFRHLATALRLVGCHLPPLDARAHRLKVFSWPFAGGTAASAKSFDLLAHSGHADRRVFNHSLIFFAGNALPGRPCVQGCSKTAAIGLRCHNSRTIGIALSRQLLQRGSPMGPQQIVRDPCRSAFTQIARFGPPPTTAAPKIGSTASPPAGPRCHHPA